MATIVNTPSGGGTTDSGSGMGFFLGMLVLLLIVILFFVYGLPAIRAGIGSSAPRVSVPDQIDVNVNNPSGQGQ